jgi:transcriptional regulator with XRE-family HTH domain
MPQVAPRPTVVLLAAMKVAFIEEISVILAKSQQIDTFADFIREAIERMDVSPSALSAQFGVTKATVSRWKNGEALPIPYMRREILKWLAHTVEAHSGFEEDHRAGQSPSSLDLRRRSLAKAPVAKNPAPPRRPAQATRLIRGRP